MLEFERQLFGAISGSVIDLEPQRSQRIGKCIRTMANSNHKFGMIRTNHAAFTRPVVW